MKYSYKKSIAKGLLQILIFAIPIAFEILPNDILNLTMGGALTAVLNWAKHNLQLGKYL